MFSVLVFLIFNKMQIFIYETSLNVALYNGAEWKMFRYRSVTFEGLIRYT